MRVDHVFHRIGNEFTRWQRIQHAVVTHRDAVIHRNRVELLGHTAHALDFARHQLPHVLQMHMPRHELGEGVGNRDDGFLEVGILHAGGAPQCACAGHVAAMGGRF